MTEHTGAGSFTSVQRKQKIISPHTLRGRKKKHLSLATLEIFDGINYHIKGYEAQSLVIISSLLNSGHIIYNTSIGHFSQCSYMFLNI